MFYVIGVTPSNAQPHAQQDITSCPKIEFISDNYLHTRQSCPDAFD